jgi:hypothetical protein
MTIYESFSGTDWKLTVNDKEIGEAQCFDIDTHTRMGTFVFVFFDRNPVDFFTKKFDFEIKFATDKTVLTPIKEKAEFLGVRWACAIDDIVSELSVDFKILSSSLDK